MTESISLQSSAFKRCAKKRTLFVIAILATLFLMIRELGWVSRLNSPTTIKPDLSPSNDDKGYNVQLADSPKDSSLAPTADVTRQQLLNRERLPIEQLNWPIEVLNGSCNYKSVPSRATKPGPRILCAVYTYKGGHRTKLPDVVTTWGRRCDRTIYISGPRANQSAIVDEDDEFFQSLGIEVVRLNMAVDNKQSLTTKTIKALLYVYENLIDTFDWFMKADDDTYVMVDNMRAFLQHKCPNESFTYGRHFKKHVTHGYLSGGSGYLINRESIRKFGRAMQENATFCRSQHNNEDVDIAICLQKLDIRPGDSRDDLGRERFHPEPVEKIWTSKIPWLVEYSQHEVKLGPDCCSNTSIGFHRVDLKLLHFMLYQLHK